MKSKIFPKTLRLQLPLTYAGIALLATSLIGVVLFLIISNYYQTLEQKYLDGNANGLGRSLSALAHRENISGNGDIQTNLDLFKNQATVAAFLMQSRVKILDLDLNIIADSGTPTKAWYIHLPPSKEIPLPDQDTPSGVDSTGQPFSFSPGSKPESMGQNPPPPGFNASPNMFGFMLESEIIENGPRSKLKGEAAFFDQNDQELGSIQISESPEYGRSIINKVIQGWLIASLISLAVSIVIGWLVSRQITRPISALESATIRMKEGDFAARAPRLKPAELSSLADTFNQMAERIQKNVDTLRRFVSDAAHEIRTPLTALHADLSLALTEKDPDKSAGLVSRSLDQVKRLEQLSKDLLDLSKIEVDNADNLSEQFDLRQLLLQASEIHASAAEQAGIEFRLDMPESPTVAMGNPLQIHRAVYNLMENAVKFTPTGGCITIKLSKEDAWALITFEDNGIGVLPEEKDLVFNHFYRSRNVSGYPGSGLGLAIAKAIIENHHGEIGMLPVDNKTCFFIRLKLAD